MTFARYIKATGEVISNFTCDTAYLDDQLETGVQGGFAGGLDGATRYITRPGGTPTDTARPASSAAYSGNATLANDGADTGTITPIGSTAVVTITGTALSGREFPLTVFDPWGADDTLEFTSTIEGDYTVTIDDFPDVQAVFVIPVRA